MNTPRSLVLLTVSTLLTQVTCLGASPYAVGDIISDFSLVRRDDGKPMSRSDFAGKIVFLDWFAWWCPFCQAAAPQLLEGIDQWYAARGGNPDGIEVVHVGINLQPGQESQTQNFVQRAGLDLVLQDFNRAVANQFFPQGGQPIFAIINGVDGSPTHSQWELIYSRLGYGERQFPVSEFRAAIDSVRKPSPPPTPPRLSMPSRHPDGGLAFILEGEPGRTYQIESSPDLVNWTVSTSVTNASNGETIWIDGGSSPSASFFRAVTR